MKKTKSLAVHSAITAVLVPEKNRLDWLPRHFGGRLMLRFEATVHTFMTTICPDYSGGYWHFYDLSNGGCFMSPEIAAPVSIQVHGNGYDGSMSAQAAGIVVNLLVLSHLSFVDTNPDRLTERFHQLRDFVYGHSEASTIWRAID